jgi:predicted alpha/beta superfamily hydrolase
MKDDRPAAWLPFQPMCQQTRLLTSVGGRRYRLVIARPRGEPPESGFPLLVALDGGRHFAALAAAAGALSHRPDKTGVVPIVVVGLCHDEAPIEDARSRDFTGSPPENLAWDRPFGGADAFRQFLSDQVIPAIAATVSSDPARRALFGHSLGGLFVLETKAALPDAFTHWISISPSLWWSTPDPAIGDASVLLGCGERETGRNMQARIEAWAAASAGARLLTASGADHGSAPFVLGPDVLRHVCAGLSKRS